jgi:transcription antitermination factor NusG
MPILAQETSLYPTSLLSQAEQELASCGATDDDRAARWWSIYTRSRQEKQLMRKLVELKTAFCCPTIERRYRAPNGRIRRVFEPLFSNYVFVYGDASARYAALTTNCVSQCQAVGDGLRLTHDLAQIQRLIETGEPLSPEAKLEPGDQVRVKTGSFAGFEGTIVQRQNETRLLVAVNFMQQGASVLLQDCQLEYLRPSTALANKHEKVKGSVDVVYKLQSGRYEVPLTRRSG